MDTTTRMRDESAKPWGETLSAQDQASAVTSGAGLVAALVGGVILVALAARGDDWQLAGASVFAVTLLLLYLSSTLYHAATNPAARMRLKVFDHCSIYLLIAGTYTPFTLIALRGHVGWWLFAAIWSLALLGIVFKLFFTGRFKLLSTLVYFAMGWMAIVAIKPVLAALDDWTFGWMLAGGLVYTLGTVFYHRPSMRYSHAVWHLFVIGGSACHYIAVLAQVLPPG
jgi:hemolysin III